MKSRMSSVLLVAGLAFAQDAQEKATSPIMVYWKTLTSAEKEVYLFAYLTQVYDTHTSLVREKGRGEFAKWFYKNRAELAYELLDQLKGDKLAAFVSYVDDFYGQEEFHDRPFHEAVSYAHSFSKMRGKTLLDKFQSLFSDTTAAGE